MKCTIDRYCSTLEERITGHNPSKQPGFAIGSIMNFGPGKKRVIVSPVWFIAPKSAELPEEERGLYLNFCPWCGFDMAPCLERFKAELAEPPEPEEPVVKKVAKPAKLKRRA